VNKLYQSIFLLIFSLPALAAELSSGQFITLGTAGGPNAEVARSQPANALLIGNDVCLVDADDFAVQENLVAW